MSLKVLIEN